MHERYHFLACLTGRMSVGSGLVSKTSTTRNIIPQLYYEFFIHFRFYIEKILY